MYYVYILTNSRKTVLYTGSTGDLEKRIYFHKRKHSREKKSALIDAKNSTWTDLSAAGV